MSSAFIRTLLALLLLTLILQKSGRIIIITFLIIIINMVHNEYVALFDLQNKFYKGTNAWYMDGYEKN